MSNDLIMMLSRSSENIVTNGIVADICCGNSESDACEIVG
jgi:hypothetical protein